MDGIINSQLEPSFMKLFGIESVIKRHEATGQKQVYIVTRNGEKQAFKIFRNGIGQREDKEIKILQKYSNIKGIPKVLEIGEHNGKAFIFEEYAEGDNLEEIKNLYTGNYQKVKDFVIGICNILNPLRNDGVTHRDLKPSNIIIGKDCIYVLDFGIARLEGTTTITDTGFQPNSRPNAAPEQLLAEKENIGTRTDFFCIGILAYELYYGKLPFGSTKEEIIQKFKNEPLEVTIDQDCRLAPFFNAALQRQIYNRPRNVENLLSLL